MPCVELTNVTVDAISQLDRRNLFFFVTFKHGTEFRARLHELMYLIIVTEKSHLHNSFHKFAVLYF